MQHTIPVHRFRLTGRPAFRAALALLAVVVLLCCGLPFARPVHAMQSGEGLIRVAVQPSVTQLSADQQMVDLCFYAQNLTAPGQGIDLENLTVWYKDSYVARFGRLKADQGEQTQVASQMITAEECGMEQTVLFRFNIGNINYESSATFVIAAPGQSAPPNGGQATATPAPGQTALPINPVLQLQRIVSPGAEVMMGDELTLTYQVHNPNLVAVNQVVVTDGSLGYIGTIQTLEPMQTAQLEHTLRLVRPLDSQPVATGYTAYGAVEATADLLTINVLRPKVAVTVTLDNQNVSVGDRAVITGKVENQGDFDIANFSLQADSLGVIAQTPLLKQGESLVVSYSFTVPGDAVLKLTSAGLTPTGLAFDQDAGELVLHADMLPESYHVTLLATADRTRLPQPGAVVITVTARNTGLMPLTDLEVVLDQATDKRALIGDLQPNQEASQTFTLSLQETREYYIYCTYTGARNLSVRSDATTLKITVAQETNIIETDNPLKEELFVGMMQSLNSITGNLMVVIVLLLGLMALAYGLKISGILPEKRLPDRQRGGKKNKN